MKLEDIANMNLAEEQPVEITLNGSWIFSPIIVGYFSKVKTEGEFNYFIYSTERVEGYGLSHEHKILVSDIESITILERKSA